MLGPHLRMSEKMRVPPPWGSAQIEKAIKGVYKVKG